MDKEIYIDDSHTKCFLAQMIQNSNMDIYQPYLYTKEKLLCMIKNYILTCNHELTFYDNTYPFTNKQELILFLGEPPYKLTTSERRQINQVAKSIISFCKSGYNFNKSKFNSFDDVRNACEKIKDHGDIFCVRTALSLFNLTIDKQEDKIVPKLSPMIHNKLQLKNHYRNNCIPTLQIKRGTFLVVFD